MKVGDLAITHQGNLCIILEVGTLDGISGNPDWYNIVFCSTGFLRSGYPAEWLRGVQ